MEILKKKRENSMYPEENAFRKEGGETEREKLRQGRQRGKRGENVRKREEAQQDGQERKGEKE